MYYALHKDNPKVLSFTPSSTFALSIYCISLSYYYIYRNLPYLRHISLPYLNESVAAAQFVFFLGARGFTGLRVFLNLYF